MLSMVKGGALPILIFLFTFTIASAQEHSRKTLLPHLWEDQKRIWTSPVAPLILLGIFAASFSLDGAPSRDLRRDGRFQDFNESFNSTPSHLVLAGFPLLVLATGKTVRNQDLIEGGWKFSEATLNALVVSHVLKGITQRSRPHTGKEYGFWKGGNSFPSGHAAVAWSLAAATSQHFKEEKWVQWIVYPLAGVVSFSRVSSGNHFASDAVIGSALGYLIGKYVAH